MSQQFSNWQITNEFLKHLIYRIQRRSNEDYAVSILYSVVDNLKSKNDFFQHIQIVDNRENDDFNHIKVNIDINSIEFFIISFELVKLLLCKIFPVIISILDFIRFVLEANKGIFFKIPGSFKRIPVSFGDGNAIYIFIGY